MSWIQHIIVKIVCAALVVPAFAHARCGCGTQAINLRCCCATDQCGCCCQTDSNQSGKSANPTCRSCCSDEQSSGSLETGFCSPQCQCHLVPVDRDPSQRLSGVGDSKPGHHLACHDRPVCSVRLTPVLIASRAGAPTNPLAKTHSLLCVWLN